MNTRYLIFFSPEAHKQEKERNSAFASQRLSNINCLNNSSSERASGVKSAGKRDRATRFYTFRRFRCHSSFSPVANQTEDFIGNRRCICCFVNELANLLSNYPIFARGIFPSSDEKFVNFWRRDKNSRKYSSDVSQLSQSFSILFVFGNFRVLVLDRA